MSPNAKDRFIGNGGVGETGGLTRFERRETLNNLSNKRKRRAKRGKSGDYLLAQDTGHNYIVRNVVSVRKVVPFRPRIVDEVVEEVHERPMKKKKTVHFVPPLNTDTETVSVLPVYGTEC